MQKNDDQISGDELNESSRWIDKENELMPEEEDSKGTLARYRRKRRFLLFIAPGLCLLIGLGYFYLKPKHTNIRPKAETIQLQRLKIPKDQLLFFHSFIIPLEEKKGLTYISLSIFFNVPNKQLRQEIEGEKEQLRGMMYDILREEINKGEEVPPLKKIKGFLIRKVNTALSTGKVKEVYITKFLAV